MISTSSEENHKVNVAVADRILAEMKTEKASSAKGPAVGRGTTIDDMIVRGFDPPTFHQRWYQYLLSNHPRIFMFFYGKQLMEVAENWILGVTDPEEKGDSEFLRRYLKARSQLTLKKSPLKLEIE